MKKKFLLALSVLMADPSFSAAQSLGTPKFNSVDMFKNNTTLDVTGAWNGSTDRLLLSPGNNISYYGLPGFVAGDHQRASIYSYQTSKFDVSKGEYPVTFDFKVTTGKAVDWFQSAAFQPNDLIHGRASGQDGIYKMTGVSACVTAGVGSGPSGLVPGVPEADGTCTWEYQFNGITDGKVGFANAVVAETNAGHVWGMANNVVYGSPLYHGSFIASAEFDLQIGFPQDCIPGLCNAYNIYLTGLQAGTITSEIGVSRDPAEAPLWTASTSYKPYQIIRTNVAAVDRVYRTQSSNACISSTTMPSGTGTSISDGTCVWEYVADGTQPFAAHYGLLFSGARAIKDATINDSTNAERGIQFFGQHSNANIDATAQSASTTPFFAKLPQGQSICFNGSAQCIVSAGSNTLRLNMGGFNVLEFSNTASGTPNYFGFQNAGAGFGPILSAVGGDTNIPLNIQGKGLSAVQVIGSGGLSVTANAVVTGNFSAGGATVTFGGLPTSGTTKGTVCITTSNTLYVKTTAGACL